MRLLKRLCERLRCHGEGWVVVCGWFSSTHRWLWANKWWNTSLRWRSYDHYCELFTVFEELSGNSRSKNRSPVERVTERATLARSIVTVLLEVSSTFQGQTNACYIANILKAFETKEEAQSYVEMRRPVLPNNYTEKPHHISKTEKSRTELTSDSSAICCRRQSRLKWRMPFLEKFLLF